MTFRTGRITRYPTSSGPGWGWRCEPSASSIAALRAAIDEREELQPDQRAHRSLRPQPRPRAARPAAVSKIVTGRHDPGMLIDVPLPRCTDEMRLSSNVCRCRLDRDDALQRVPTLGALWV